MVALSFSRPMQSALQELERQTETQFDPWPVQQYLVSSQVRRVLLNAFLVPVGRFPIMGVVQNCFAFGGLQ